MRKKKKNKSKSAFTPFLPDYQKSLEVFNHINGVDKHDDAEGVSSTETCATSGDGIATESLVGKGLPREALIDQIKKFGKNYKFDKYSDQALFRILNRLNDKNEIELALAEPIEEPQKKQLTGDYVGSIANVDIYFDGNSYFTSDGKEFVSYEDIYDELGEKYMKPKCDENLVEKALLDEDSSAKLSPEDREEVKKVIQNTDDAETIAAVIAAKAQKNESVSGGIDLTDYDEVDSITDSGVIYKLFRKVVDGKGVWAAQETKDGEAVGEPFQITYEQAREFEPLNGVGVMQRRLGKKLLPKCEALDDSHIPAPYNDFFVVSEASEYDEFKPGDPIPNYDCKFIAYLEPKDEYADLINSYPLLTDDSTHPVVDLAGGRLYPLDIDEIIEQVFPEDDYEPDLTQDNLEAGQWYENLEKHETPLAEASYGGAYDIADDQFFTREELNEFAYDVIDGLTSILNRRFDLVGIYCENNIIEICVIDVKSEIEETVFFKLDMRKIRKPADLSAYYLHTTTEELLRKFNRDLEFEDTTDEAYECMNESVSVPENIKTGIEKILNSNGFTIEAAGTTLFGNLHWQVIHSENVGLDIDNAKLRDIVSPLINSIHKFEIENNVYITWNFGVNKAGYVTGGVDLVSDPAWKDENQQQTEGLCEDQQINENGTISTRKKNYINMFNKLSGQEIQRSDVQQHHNDGNSSNNPKDFSNYTYLYSTDGSHVEAHKYIHAKSFVENYTPGNVYMLSLSDDKAEMIPVTTEQLDALAHALTTNKETSIVTSDEPAIKSVSESVSSVSLEDAVIDCIDWCDTVEYEFPIDRFSATSWGDLRDGIEMGIDDVHEVAENLYEYMKPIIDYDNGYQERNNSEPSFEDEIDIFDNLSRALRR